MVECLFVNFTRRQTTGQKSANLRREEKHSLRERVVERFDAGPVTAQEQSLGSLVPDPQSKVAVYPLEKAWPMVFVEMNQCFGVRLRAESVSVAAQLLPKLRIVVDLTVEGHPDTVVLVRHRLLAGRRQIDDCQPTVPQGDRAGQPRPTGQRCRDRGAAFRRSCEQPIPGPPDDWSGVQWHQQSTHTPPGSCDFASR